MSRRGIAAVAVVGVALATPALTQPRSQNYPERAVTSVVAVAPGGGIDTLARAFADKLRERLGQAVVVENRAVQAGHRRRLCGEIAPDGYTLLITSTDEALAK
jgi:tripartite-type tricarboxylate transporter receptor subunit TctC